MELKRDRLDELKMERLRLIKERHRELILKPREEDGPNFGDIFYDWDETADVFDDATLAREMRRQQEEYDD